MSYDNSKLNDLEKQVKEQISLFNLDNFSVEDFNAWITLFTKTVFAYNLEKANKQLVNKMIKDADKSKSVKGK